MTIFWFKLALRRKLQKYYAGADRRELVRLGHAHLHEVLTKGTFTSLEVPALDDQDDHDQLEMDGQQLTRHLQEEDNYPRQLVTFRGCVFEENSQPQRSAGSSNGVVDIQYDQNDVVIEDCIFSGNVFNTPVRHPSSL